MRLGVRRSFAGTKALSKVGPPTPLTRTEFRERTLRES